MEIPDNDEQIMPAKRKPVYEDDPYEFEKAFTPKADAPVASNAVAGAAMDGAEEAKQSAAAAATTAKEMSFREKFAAERAAGKKVFDWQGKSYTTELKVAKQVVLPDVEIAGKRESAPAKAMPMPKPMDNSVQGMDVAGTGRVMPDGSFRRPNGTVVSRR